MNYIPGAPKWWMPVKGPYCDVGVAVLLATNSAPFLPRTNVLRKLLAKSSVIISVVLSRIRRSLKEITQGKILDPRRIHTSLQR